MSSQRLLLSAEKCSQYFERWVPASAAALKRSSPKIGTSSVGDFAKAVWTPFGWPVSATLKYFSDAGELIETLLLDDVGERISKAA